MKQADSLMSVMRLAKHGDVPQRVCEAVGRHASGIESSTGALTSAHRSEPFAGAAHSRESQFARLVACREPLQDEGPALSHRRRRVVGELARQWQDSVSEVTHLSNQSLRCNSPHQGGLVRGSGDESVQEHRRDRQRSFSKHVREASVTVPDIGPLPATCSDPNRLSHEQRSIGSSAHCGLDGLRRDIRQILVKHLRLKCL